MTVVLSSSGSPPPHSRSSTASNNPPPVLPAHRAVSDDISRYAAFPRMRIPSGELARPDLHRTSKAVCKNWRYSESFDTKTLPPSLWSVKETKNPSKGSFKLFEGVLFFSIDLSDRNPLCFHQESWRYSAVSKIMLSVCPKCRSENVRRSYVRLRDFPLLLLLIPIRCWNCHVRFYAFRYR